jgi:NADH dehydrogenase
LLIYGPGDKFTIRLSEMLRLAPVMPVIGSGKYRVQPIYIDDVVSCMVKAVTGDAFLNEIYEIGGPDQLTYEEVTKAIAEAMGLKRMVHVPLFFMKPIARALETVSNPLTTNRLSCSRRHVRHAGYPRCSGSSHCALRWTQFPSGLYGLTTEDVRRVRQSLYDIY